MTERHVDEVLTDNAALKHFSQCESCIFRYKDYFEFRGKRYPCSPTDGWKKGCCQMYQDPQTKPPEVYDNTGTCEYYEKDQ